MSYVDLVLIHPGAASQIYQGLASDFSAIEPPLWCRLLAGAVRDKQYSVAIIDAEALSLTPSRVAIQVREYRPQLVGIVCFGHQPSASTQQMVGASATRKALADICPDIPVVMLGGHVSALPELTVIEEACYAAKGEGVATLLGLLDGLPNKDVPGLVWTSPAGIVINPGAPLADIPRGDLHGNAWDLLPMDKYRAHNWQCFGDLSKRRPYASIYTSLGCPYKCSFCCINAPFDSNKYRMRDPAAVVREINNLMFYHGVHTFKIVDEMFVLNDRHVNAICDWLIDCKLGDYLNIWAYARVDTVKSPEQLDKLRAAGVRWLALGIESGSKHVRDGSQKALKNDDILKTVKLIQQAGINVIGNYIFGLPDDTDETMKDTLALALEANCEFANFYSAMAYPGSALYGMAIKDGLKLPAEWSGYSQHSFDCTPLPTATLTAAEVLRFRDSAFHKYFTDPSYLGMVKRKFGVETVEHINRMVAQPLPRKLLGGVDNMRAHDLEPERNLDQLA
jgi:radical SAM superfamily enzyme YgiQ (UPF0313 family)